MTDISANRLCAVAPRRARLALLEWLEWRAGSRSRPARAVARLALTIDERRIRVLWATIALIGFLGVTLAGARTSPGHHRMVPAAAHQPIPNGLRSAATASGSTHASEPPAAALAAPPPPTVGAPAAGAAPATASTAVIVPSARGALPVGKGMWLWQPQAVEGGNVAAIVAKAQAAGLTHLYVRVGSSIDGFNGGPFLSALLPAAHAAHIRVFGWDFPYLANADADVARAYQAITFTAPGGDRIDGFAADIELASEGVNISPATATVYTSHLRHWVGAGYPLIAVVPQPTPEVLGYPYNEVAANFDAIAPMAYWLNREPGADVAAAISGLQGLGKPILPVGQAYDGGGEGGPPGLPTPQDIQRFMAVADQYGAAGVSFWSWQHADQAIFDAIAASPDFALPAAPAPMTPGQVRSWQVLLTSLGYSAPATGTWDAASTTAVRAYQRAAHLPPTGVVDGATARILLTPFPPPIQIEG